MFALSLYDFAYYIMYISYNLISEYQNYMILNLILCMNTPSDISITLYLCHMMSKIS